MFREIRFIKRKLDDERTKRILTKGLYGILSTCGADGYAYGVPLNYVFENGCIYFHGAVQGKKLDNIAANNRVCFTVTGSAEVKPEAFTTAYESVVALGIASLTQGEEKLHALRLLLEKYSPDYLEEGMKHVEGAKDHTAVVKIEIQNLCGKGSF